MKFHWTFVKTSRREESSSVVVDIGAQICGLQLKGSRPHTVEVTGEELKYLLQNPKYTFTSVIPSLATVSSNGFTEE